MKFLNLNITVKFMMSQTCSKVLVSRAVRLSSEVQCKFQKENSWFLPQNFAYIQLSIDYNIIMYIGNEIIF